MLFLQVKVVVESRRSEGAAVLAAVLGLGCALAGSSCHAPGASKDDGSHAFQSFESLPARLRHPATGIVLVRLPAGSFERGSPAEEMPWVLAPPIPRCCRV